MPFRLCRFTLTVAFFLLSGIFACASTSDEIPPIGQINFFGYGGIDLQRAEAALPIKIGDVPVESTRDLIDQRIKAATGHGITDIDYVCCDENRHLLVYIGLAGTTSTTASFNPVPKGADRLQPSAVKLYQDDLGALAPAILRGASGEDDSKGYALGSDPQMRKIQLAMRAYALDRALTLRRVLKDSADPMQRQCAAELLGYAKRSPTQMQALADAMLDPDAEVRNNATRSLTVLASAKGAEPMRVSLKPLEAMLKSGIWSDRNKASLLLNQLTVSRDPIMLKELHATVLDVLIEGARWHGDPGHAGPFILVLARIAQLPEPRLYPAPDASAIEKIVGLARAAG